MTETDRIYTDSTEAERIETRNKNYIHGLIAMLAIWITGIIISSLSYSLPKQEIFVNLCGAGVFITSAVLAIYIDYK